MKLSDLKPLYVIETRNGNKRILTQYASSFYPDNTLFMYEPGNTCAQQIYAFFDDPDTLSVKRGSEDGFDIVRVWGHSSEFNETMTTKTDHRRVLWERPNNDGDLVFDLPTYILAEGETCHMTWLVDCHGLTKDEMGKLGYTSLPQWMTPRKKCKPLTIDQRKELVELFSK